MRSYLVTTSLIFVLILLAHVARVAVEGLGTLRDVAFVGSSVIALGMVGWSAVLLKREFGGRARQS